MGTRADYYIHKNDHLVWIGSIAWDGYPEGIDGEVLGAKTESEYLKTIKAFFDGRDDVTLPAQGWPWPWDNSGTTDYAYAFVDGRVVASRFGGVWFDPLGEGKEIEDRAVDVPATLRFPDMKEVKKVARGSNRSGVIIIGGE